MITIDRLKYFKEVATLEHVTKAAKAAHISPSVISSAIATLEDELGCSLFDKDRNRLKLNANGALLLERANKILGDLDDIYTDIADAPMKIKGHYKIGGSPFLVNEFLIREIVEIQKIHPELSIAFTPSDTAATVSNIMAGSTDLALVFKSFQHHDVEEEILYDGQFHFCARKNHPIHKASKKDRLNLLSQYPSISFRPMIGASPYESHPIFKKIGIEPKSHFYYENNYTSLKLLTITDGWAFLPDILIKMNSTNLKKIEISKNYDAPMRISLIRNKNRSYFSLYNELSNSLKFKI